MNHYTLIATKDGVRRSHKFYETDDSAAMFHGTLTVLRKAVQSPVWARGRIVLTNRTTGEVLATMDEKVAA